MESITKKFGENVRMYRQRLGLTQDELAQMVGYSYRSAINKIEKGERDVSTPIIAALANALHVSVTDLIGTAEQLDVFKDFYEYLPYLMKADEWQIKAVREILHMPDCSTKKEISSNCMKIIG